MYYLRRFVSVKEPILLGVLIIIGILLLIFTQRMFVIIMCGVVVVIIGIAFLIYAITSIKGYNLEFKKREATHWEMFFNETGYMVDTYEKNGEVKYTEKKLFAEVDRVAILKDKVYIYATPAVVYYVLPNSFSEGNFPEFCEWLKTVVPPEKQRMRYGKKRIKQFPYNR